MLTKSRFIGSLINSRCLSKSSVVNFKFKLTDELSREYEEKEKQKLESMKAPELALHTRESSLIMGKVSHDRYNKVVKVGVPKHRLNEFILMYIRELDNIQAYDEKDECNPGDWVLLRRLAEPLDTGVEHRVERIVYQYGKWIDPLTGRRSLGLYYDDDMQKLENIKIDL